MSVANSKSPAPIYVERNCSQCGEVKPLKIHEQDVSFCCVKCAEEYGTVPASPSVPAPMSVSWAIRSIRSDIQTAQEARSGITPFSVDVDYLALKTLLAAYEESQIEITRLSEAVEFHNRVSLERGIEDAREGRVSRFDPFAPDSHLLDTGDDIGHIEELLDLYVDDVVQSALSSPTPDGKQIEPGQAERDNLLSAIRKLKPAHPIPDTEKVKTEPMEELDDLIMQYATEEWASDRTISQEESDHCRTEKERLLTAIHQHVAALVQTETDRCKNLVHGFHLFIPGISNE